MQSLKLYPNPLKRNTSLTIEMYKHEEGAHLFQLSAVNGQIIVSEEMWIDENSRIGKLDIPTVAAGAYLLRVINKQTGKSKTEKIIIQ